MSDTEAKTDTFENDKVTLSVTRKENCQVEFDVKATKELALKGQKEALKEVAKNVSLPGFRKGKAPDNLLLKTYPDQVKEKAQKKFADIVFMECMNLTKIPVLRSGDQITFNMKNYQLNDTSEMTFSFESEPTVPSVDASTIKLKQPKKEEITEEKLNDSVKNMQMYFAKWEEIKDKAIELGDFVTLDADVLENDKYVNAFQNTRFEATEEKMAKWMLDLVLNHKVGESLEGVSKPDQDATEEDKKKFEEKKVKLHITKVEKCILPELDDKLAEQMGAKNVEELKKKLKDLLIKQAEEAVQKDLREQVNDELIKHFSFDLPRSLLGKETAYRLSQHLKETGGQASFEKLDDNEKHKIVEPIEKQARESLTLYYLSSKVLFDSKIQIKPSEIEEAMHNPLEALYGDQNPAYSSKSKSQEQRALATSRLMLTKAQDHLINQVTEKK